VASEGRCGRRTTRRRTTGAETRRRANTGTEARGRTSEGRRRTRRRPELRDCGVRRGDGGAEQHARGQVRRVFVDVSLDLEL
jgi:hypothetical protein